MNEQLPPSTEQIDRMRARLLNAAAQHAPARRRSRVAVGAAVLVLLAGVGTAGTAAASTAGAKAPQAAAAAQSASVSGVTTQCFEFPTGSSDEYFVLQGTTPPGIASQGVMLLVGTSVRAECPSGVVPSQFSDNPTPCFDAQGNWNGLLKNPGRVPQAELCGRLGLSATPKQ